MRQGAGTGPVGRLPLSIFVILGLLAVMPASQAVAADVEWVIVVDVPAALGGAERLPNELIRTDGSSYSLVAALPPATAVGSLDLRADGAWLFSPTEPVSLGGALFEARDVIAWNGASFATVLDGSTAGIPGSTRIDALDERADGSLLLSFDVPTTIGATTYGRNDIVRYHPVGGFSAFFQAAAAGVPAYANVIAAGIDGSGKLVIGFDVPTNLGGVDFRPGQLVWWNGSSFSLYAADPVWPGFAQIRGVGFYPSAGAVPDGDHVPGTLLTVEELPNGDLRLAWGASCLPGDTDYVVYRGHLGQPGSHIPVLCSTGGLRSVVVPSAGSSEYFLVVPRNAWREGSHGVTGTGIERPPGPATCLPQQPANSCQ